MDILPMFLVYPVEEENNKPGLSFHHEPLPACCPVFVNEGVTADSVSRSAVPVCLNERERNDFKSCYQWVFSDLTPVFHVIPPCSEPSISLCRASYAPPCSPGLRRDSHRSQRFCAFDEACSWVISFKSSRRHFEAGIGTSPCIYSSENSFLSLLKTPAPGHTARECRAEIWIWAAWLQAPGS